MLKATKVGGGVDKLAKPVVVNLDRHVVSAPDVVGAGHNVAWHALQDRPQAGKQNLLFPF